MKRSATLSDDGIYRYRLGRRWGAGPALVFVMLNPSTADAMQDDPTIRRCVGFAKRDGYPAIDVVNLFALRATKPVRVAEALAAGRDVAGPENYLHLLGAIVNGARDVVVGWGGSIERVPGWQHRVAAVCDLAHGNGRDLVALGHTAEGHPRHPLYVRADAPLVDAVLA